MTVEERRTLVGIIVAIVCMAAIAAALSGCERTVYRSARSKCLEPDRAAENAAIIACIAAGERRGDDDADELADSCASAMRDSLCTKAEWFYQERLHGDQAPSLIVTCERGTPTQQNVCRNFGWKPERK